MQRHNNALNDWLNRHVSERISKNGKDGPTIIVFITLYDATVIRCACVASTRRKRGVQRANECVTSCLEMIANASEANRVVIASDAASVDLSCVYETV